MVLLGGGGAKTGGPTSPTDALILDGTGSRALLPVPVWSAGLLLLFLLTLFYSDCQLLDTVEWKSSYFSCHPNKHKHDVVVVVVVVDAA